MKFPSSFNRFSVKGKQLALENQSRWTKKPRRKNPRSFRIQTWKHLQVPYFRDPASRPHRKNWQLHQTSAVTNNISWILFFLLRKIIFEYVGRWVHASNSRNAAPSRYQAFPHSGFNSREVFPSANACSGWPRHIQQRLRLENKVASVGSRSIAWKYKATKF